jgi:hypothetical protein
MIPKNFVRDDAGANELIARAMTRNVHSNQYKINLRRNTISGSFESLKSVEKVFIPFLFCRFLDAVILRPGLDQAAGFG